MHERRLHVDAENHAEPDQVDAEFFRHRPEQRDDDEGEFEEVEEEGKNEDKRVDENEEADLAAGEGSQQMLDPYVAVHAVEGQREHACTDQDEYDEGGKLRGRFRGLPDQVPAQPSLGGAENDRAGSAHRATLGGGRDADEDRTEHKEDQEQRRHHYKRRLLRHR